jgi:quinol monooxygenase YgiN
MSATCSCPQQQVWTRTQHIAQQQSGFYSIRLLRDVAQPGHYVMLSEWDSRNDYDHFVRASGLYWLDRALELWQSLPPVIFEEVLANADALKGG